MNRNTSPTDCPTTKDETLPQQVMTIVVPGDYPEKGRAYESFQSSTFKFSVATGELELSGNRKVSVPFGGIVKAFSYGQEIFYEYRKVPKDDVIEQ